LIARAHTHTHTRDRDRHRHLHHHRKDAEDAPDPAQIARDMARLELIKKRR
jgi:hypothetical protein